MRTKHKFQLEGKFWNQLTTIGTTAVIFITITRFQVPYDAIPPTCSINGISYQQHIERYLNSLFQKKFFISIVSCRLIVWLEAGVDIGILFRRWKGIVEMWPDRVGWKYGDEITLLLRVIMAYLESTDDMMFHIQQNIKYRHLILCVVKNNLIKS